MVFYTPKPDCFLDGITRRTVINSQRNGYKTIEKKLTLNEISEAEECSTGTAAEVTPVNQIGEDLNYSGELSFGIKAYENEVNK